MALYIAGLDVGARRRRAVLPARKPISGKLQIQRPKAEMLNGARSGEFIIMQQNNPQTGGNLGRVC